MREYKLDKKYLYITKTVTKGTQEKYYRNGYYYKIDKQGREGYVEWIVSRLLSCSTLESEEYVTYEYCKINGKSGCRSASFVEENERFETISSIYEYCTGYENLIDKLNSMPVEKRLDYILDIAVTTGINRAEYKLYLNKLLQLDLLIRNTDRHEHNYGINRKGNRVRISPIFDNGCSLDTNRTGNDSSCTLCGSFENQIIQFGYPYKSVFKLDYKKVERELKEIETLYGRSYELDNLRNKLQQFSSIFKL